MIISSSVFLQLKCSGSGSLQPDLVQAGLLCVVSAPKTGVHVGGKGVGEMISFTTSSSEYLPGIIEAGATCRNTE